MMETSGLKALFTADISTEIEKILSKTADIKADILKVGHHGSKYSSSLDFLRVVSPKIAVIEVGKNSYGHPTIEALKRLVEIGSRIFRTDKDGIVKIINDNGNLKVYNIKF
jgi:competence protein ComEC